MNHDDDAVMARHARETERAARARYDFDTTPFERSHGKPPRGRGSYAFTAGQASYTDVYREVIFTPGGMTWQEAKAWIVARARSISFPSTTFYAQP